MYELLNIKHVEQYIEENTIVYSTVYQLSKAKASSYFAAGRGPHRVVHTYCNSFSAFPLMAQWNFTCVYKLGLH